MGDDDDDDNDDDGRRRRSPFPLSRFESTEDDDVNDDAAEATPSIPIGGRFLWASEGKSVGTGLKKLPEHETNALEEGPEDVWVREMKLKHRILDEYGDECVVYKTEENDEDVDRACREVLHRVVEVVTKQYPERYVLKKSGNGKERWISIPKLDGYTASVEPKSGKEALVTAARLSTNEFCVMRRRDVKNDDEEDDGDLFSKEPSEHEFVAGVVCFSFDPRKREGKNLSQLHKPVPNYEEKIAKATRRVFDNLLSKMNEDGRPLFRANWAIQNSSDLISTDLDWHPTNVRIGGVKNRKHLVEESSGFGDIDAMHTGYMDPTQGMPKNVGEVGSKLFTRVEYETISKLETNGFSLFTVKTYLEPLENFTSPEAAESLFVAITEASESELKYKSLENTDLKNLILEYLVSKLPRVPSTTTVSSNVLKCPMGFSAKMEEEEEEEEREEANTERERELVAPSQTTKALIQMHGITPWTSFDKNIEDAFPIPPSYYTSPKVAQIERATVLSPEKGWVCIGCVSDAPNVNDYFTTTLFSDENCDEHTTHPSVIEIVCVRTEEDAFKAYENVCQHHFAKVAGEKRGTCTTKSDSCVATLQCPYHGFTYDVSSDGKLISATRMRGMEERLKTMRLRGDYACETFGPFVFLRRRKENDVESSSSSLRSFLGAAFSRRVEDAGIDVSNRESFRHVAHETFEVQSNWKVFVDNYLDGGFHVPFAHKALVKEGCDMSKYKTTLFDNMNSIQFVDVKTEDATNARLGTGSATYAFAFPNVCLNRYGRWLDTNVALPHPSGDPNKCVVDFNWFIEAKKSDDDDDEDEDEDKFVRQSLDASRVVQNEDETLCALVQKGLRSKVAASNAGGTTPQHEGAYSLECESIMFAFHKRYYQSAILETLV